MYKRQNSNVVILVILMAISMMGSTTTYLKLQSWEGRSINDLYFDRGKAHEVSSAKKYYRVHTWFSKGKDGREKGCRQSFYTRDIGSDEIIVDTKYSGCHFLTVK